MTAAEIERERERLIGELWRVGHCIGMPTEEAQTARMEAMAAIRRALEELPPKPYAPTGMEYGQVWVGHLLGSMPARPELPEPELSEGVDYDPYDEDSQGWRHDHE